MTAKSLVTAGTTGTGLDQIVDIIRAEPTLFGRIAPADILGGAAVADGLNALIVEARLATGAAPSGTFTTEDVVRISEYIRANHYEAFLALHGDDEDDTETGYHLVQNDGAQVRFQGENALNTVFDGIYHIGFEIRNGRFNNEDGDANASVQDVADWLSAFFVDRATTGSGLDRLVEDALADEGLACNLPQAEHMAGLDAANDLNGLILEGLQTVDAALDGRISTEEVALISDWIRADPAREARFIAAHGDDEDGSETGFHLLQNDGAKTRRFGENLVDTVMDGIYHIGFTYEDGRFKNEDGDANATLDDVAAWIDFHYLDHSDSGTGLDWITDTIEQDQGLIDDTSAQDILGGLEAANALNRMFAQAVAETGVAADGLVTTDDVRAINTWFRATEERIAEFTKYHGDDEGDAETGFHLVQNDGGTLQFRDRALINTVADGLYHIGFAIQGNRLTNEDGDANATVGQVASWLNQIMLGKPITIGTSDADDLKGNNGPDQVLADAGDDKVCGKDGDDAIQGEAGNDLLYGDQGADLLQGGEGGDSLDGGRGADTLEGGLGDDLLTGSSGDDRMDGQEGSDSYRMSRDAGFDQVSDTGTTGSDEIRAVGTRVDLRLADSSAWQGVETITGDAAAHVRITGTSADDTLDLSRFALVNIDEIQGGDGEDQIIGAASDDVIIGGRGDDSLDGAAGSDLYKVEGTGGSFDGFDRIADTGGSGIDAVVLTGTGNTDFGIRQSGDLSGIEEIRGESFKRDRIIGDEGDDRIDLTGIRVTGIDQILGLSGNDSITGSTGVDILDGGRGVDTLDGANGGDTYLASRDSGLDQIRDSGAVGTDQILVSSGHDLTLSRFAADAGIEAIGWAGKTGRILGTANADVIDLTTVQILGPIEIRLGNGNDQVSGAKAAQTLRGEGGTDILSGGLGGDLLVGGAQADSLTGGQGADRFDFDAVAESSLNSFDRIADLGAGDLIDLATIDASSRQGGNQAFTWIGEAAFSGKAGQLAFLNGSLLGDVDGNRTADLKIQLDGIASLQVGQILL